MFISIQYQSLDTHNTQMSYLTRMTNMCWYSKIYPINTQMNHNFLWNLIHILRNKKGKCIPPNLYKHPLHTDTGLHKILWLSLSQGGNPCLEAINPSQSWKKWHIMLVQKWSWNLINTKRKLLPTLFQEAPSMYQYWGTHNTWIPSLTMMKHMCWGSKSCLIFKHKIFILLWILLKVCKS